MNKTLTFVGLDFNLIKPYRLTVLVLLGLGIAMGFAFKSTSTLSSYFMMALMLIMSYPFAIGEKNGLDTLYSTLSVSRKNVVVGRYLFVLVLEAVFAVFALLCSWILSFVINTEFVLAAELATLCLLSGIFSLVVATQYPLYFKYGYNKAKLLALIPLFTVFLVVIQLPTIAKLFGFSFTWEGFFANTMGNPVWMYAGSVGIGLLCMAMSCALSCGIYSKRDI